MRRIHALALIPFFALAACSTATTTAPTTEAPATASAPATSASATPTTAQSTGETLSGSGYTLTLPKGWEDATEAFQKLQPQVDSGAKQTKDTSDGFNDNVNVITQASAEVPFDQLQSAIKSQLEGAGSTDIEFKENAQLDGKEALQVWSHTKGAEKAHTIQFMAFNNGNMFVVTVSTNLADEKAAALAQQILSGWKWASA